MPHAFHVARAVGLVAVVYKYILPHYFELPSESTWVAVVVGVVTYLLWRKIKPLLPGANMKVEGSVIITGCDSGIGMHSAKLLASKGFHVYAGILSEKNASIYKDFSDDQLTPVVMDITSDDSVAAAVAKVEKDIKKRGDAGLVGIINVAGLGFTGPAEFFPVSFYQKQIEVNLIGPYRVTQSFLPLLRKSVCKKNARRGRILLFGTGGGVPSPAPPLLTAYMGSKWGNEALCHGLRVEMQLTNKPIDCAMINPGFIKPTALAPVGKRLLEESMAKYPSDAARAEYKPIIDQFLKFSEEQPGTRPEVVAEAVFTAMNATDLKIRYKVGFDSNASPIVGLLPTAWREWVLRKSMFSS